MRKFVTGLAVLYLFSLFFIAPPLIKMLWEIAFSSAIRKQEAIDTIIPMLGWIIGGFFFLRFLFNKRKAKLLNKIRSISPDGFAPNIELYGDHGARYVGISPTTNGLVVVDLQRKVARYESMDFLQGYLCEENGKHRYNMTIQFNSFDVPSSSFSILGDEYRNDVIAKLNYAMQAQPAYGGADQKARASINAFESVREKFRNKTRNIADDPRPDASPP